MSHSTAQGQLSSHDGVPAAGDRPPTAHNGEPAAETSAKVEEP